MSDIKNTESISCKTVSLHVKQLNSVVLQQLDRCVEQLLW